MTPSYLSNFLHSGPPQTADFEEMKLNLEELKEVNAQLTKENEELRQRVSSNKLFFAVYTPPLAL